MDVEQLVDKMLGSFFGKFLLDSTSFFATVLEDITSGAVDVLNLPLVKSATTYAQSLAIAMLIVKAGSEAFQTYILHQNGDPDADPTGLLIRTGQAVAVITCLQWIVKTLFNFGDKICQDIASFSTGTPGLSDKAFILALSSQGFIMVLFGIIILILILIVALQATIRGAELALMSVLGPIMALNITANNRSVWSAWFRQLFIICTSQAVQIFMLSGVFPLLTTSAISDKGLLLAFGWLWVTIKSPKFIQSFVYSTGLGNTIGGVARQAGTTAFMRIMMKK